MKKLNRKGFTIVELVIVIAVIAILAAVLIPTFSGVTNSAKKSAAQSTAKSSLEILLALNKGSMADGTIFLVDAKKDGATDYAFAYTGSKLRAFNDEKVTGDTKLQVQAKTVTPTSPSTVTTIYSVYVSTSAIEDNEGTKTIAENTKKVIDEFLPSTIVTTTALSSADGNQYYTLGEGSETAEIRVYYTADLDQSCVVFVGNGVAVTEAELEAAD